MTESEFLQLAKSRYSEIALLKKEESFYEYEQQFEELWLALGKEVFERSISETSTDRRKKKLNSRLGQIEISKSHPWSDGLHEMQISPYLQELQAYAGQNDNYESAAGQLEKYLRIPINSSQIKRVTKTYSEILTDSEYHTKNKLQSVQEAKVVEMKEAMNVPNSSEVVYGMVDGAMLQTCEGEQKND